MEGRIFKNWWILTFKGLLAISLGVYSIASSVMTINFVKHFAWLIIVTGSIVAIGGFLQRKQNPRWGFWIFEGIIDIIIGIIIFQKPLWFAATLLILMALWAILSGLVQILSSITFRKIISNWWSLMIFGIVFILMAILAILNPFEGRFTVVSVAGVFIVIFGLVLIIYSLQLRKAKID